MGKLTKEKILSTIQMIKEAAYSLTYSDGTSVLSKTKPPKSQIISSSKVDELCSLTFSILTKVYGQTSEHIQNFRKQLSDYYNPRINSDYDDVLLICIGKLDFLKSEIELDILTSIENEITGEVYGDLLVMAREAIENSAKDTAAVLGCAALEDALKRIAKTNNLETDDKSMSEIVNSLKSIGLIKGIQATLLTSFVKLRNKAFHAEWTKLDTADVKSLIGFTEEFIITHF
ncbi:hypothetical protein QWZ08_02670 [Ferruginibacter paludis]|uniref:hypothetical protein n=1 Tax=Ferruginibacter paludis TaxID=1310417 RepID=UPI0025B4D657|nr:hypothetical protein [Ferruginibacter paludis]MDN3654511.1 hypothetical protein [Ferruginibacter paludis]